MMIAVLSFFIGILRWRCTLLCMLLSMLGVLQAATERQQAMAGLSVTAFLKNRSGQQLVPLASGRFLYVLERHGRVRKYDFQTRQVIWSQTLAQRLSSPASLYQHQLLLGTEDGTVVVINSETGQVTFQIEAGARIGAAPITDGKLIAVQTIDERLQVFTQKKSHSLLWSRIHEKRALTLAGTAQPVFFQGRIITGFSNGELMAFNAQDGTIVMKQTLGQASGFSNFDRLADLNACCVIDRQRVYAAGYKGHLVAVESTGNAMLIDWKYPTSTHQSFAVDTQHLYLTTQDHMQAINKQGKLLWQIKTSVLTEQRVTAPVLFGNHLVLGDQSGAVSFFSKKTGQYEGQYAFSQTPRSTVMHGSRQRFMARKTLHEVAISVAPVVAGQYLIVLNDNGQLFSIDFGKHL